MKCRGFLRATLTGAAILLIGIPAYLHWKKMGVAVQKESTCPQK